MDNWLNRENSGISVSDDVTYILNAVEKGDARAAEELLPLVYQELRLLATQRLSLESPSPTLQATALVHEAFIRLVGTENPNWNSSGHFFGAAAEAMRRILIENARRKKSLKHGGNCQRVDVEGANLAADGPSDDLIALDEALTKLSKKDKIKAELVKLRYFAGLTIEQTAQILDISPATANRYWDYARTWLRWEIVNSNE
ncbi:MAG: sigma-70 family RNA polymerase sigma factor [Planctomycetes bacterium]|nr:sigma-70 family RNA polymerase sigma factor [Planctomycetota bacterium]